MSDEEKDMILNQGEILLYQTEDGKTKIDVTVADNSI